MSRDDDRGVATILVVLLMPVLVVFAALVFDGGRSIVARRQAQNAADAGALAKARDCAMGLAGTNLAPYQTDGATLSSLPVCGAGSTTVSMTRPVALAFAPAGGTRNVTRSATARWSPLGEASTLPLTVADCEFSAALLHGTTDVTLLLDNPQPLSGCSSLPGGFSQLAGTDCDVVVSASSTAPGKPGNDLQDVVPCLQPLPREVVIPLYDAVECATAGCKGRGPYPIAGFAAFRITGYWFTNNNRSAGTLANRGCPAPVILGVSIANGTGPANCIQGDFVRYATSLGSPGGSRDFGAHLTYLSD